MEEWFPLLQAAMSALPAPPDMEQWLNTTGLQRTELHLLFVAYLGQSPFAFSTLADWMPYNAPGLLKQRLEALREKGLLQTVSANRFRLTEQAVPVVQSWIEKVRTHLAALMPLPRPDLQRLSALLSHLVQAALTAPPPPSHDRLLSSRRVAPVASAPPMLHIDQYLTDMLFLRDDAHVSAWRPYKLDGPAVEVLTLLWRGEAQDLDGLSAALSERRGYSRDDYAAFVQGLHERGLVDASGPVLALTPQGHALREEIEVTTNRYYMFPWTALNPTAVQELHSLLQRFVQALKGS